MRERNLGASITVREPRSYSISEMAVTMSITSPASVRRSVGHPLDEYYFFRFSIKIASYTYFTNVSVSNTVIDCVTYYVVR